MARHTNREVNTERLASLYDEHAEAIYRYCFFRVFSKPRAEELMQDTFLKLWRYIEQGKELKNARALLYTIATHLVIDEKRKNREESLDQLLEQESLQEPSSPGAEQQVMQPAMLREVREAMQKLTPEEQDLFTMRYVSDMDPKEIAVIKGTSANVVSVQLNRIATKLRTIIS